MKYPAKSHPAWNKGLKVYNSGKNNPFYGKRHTQETKDKIRKILKEKGIRPLKPYIGRGEKSTNWRGGVTPFYELLRKSDQYIQWRMSVLVKDNFTCQGCGKRGGKLEAHHKKSFFDIIFDNKIKDLDSAYNCNDLWDVNNGETFCRICHLKTESWGKSWRLKTKQHCD